LPRASPAIIARRRVLALAIIWLLAVSVIAVVVATSGGDSPTPTASTPQPTREQAAGKAASPEQPTRPAVTQPTPPSTSLKVTLPPNGQLSNGDSGPAVLTLQKALILLGYKLGTPDGDFGSTTQAVVASFQTAHALTPDGIVGAATAQKLNAQLASRARPG
jgi:peptidoglycan hydrolase-like protein with peptidoglycan-binding domain